MKNNSILLFFVLTTIISLTFFIFEYNYNKKIEISLEKKDKIIRNILIKDSIIYNSNKSYSEKIDKYVKNCSFNFNGNIITSEELIELFVYENKTRLLQQDSLDYLNKLIKIKEKELDVYKKGDKSIKNILYSYKRMNDSLFIFRDSFYIYKALNKTIKNEYDINYIAKMEGNKLLIIKNINKVDSALAVYKYYKNKLKVDEKGDWIITIESEIKKKKKNK